MCNVKEGANITSNADFQNLITSVILRQTSKFTLEDICKGVCTRGKGSSFVEDTAFVEKSCEDTISTLFNCGGIEVLGKGVYKLHLSFPAI